MKIKGFVTGYIVMMMVLSAGAAVFCYVMDGRDLLPEAYTVAGGLMGFCTLLYALFVVSRIYSVWSQASEVGHIKTVTECVGHVGRKRGVRCSLAVGFYGIVLEAPSIGCRSVLYEDFMNYKAKPFEIMFTEGGTDYRLVFDKKLKTKVTSDYIEKQMAELL